MLQGVHSRLMLRCPHILWEEPGISPQEPGHRFPAGLAAAFLSPAPFVPLLSSLQDVSPLRARCWGCCCLSWGLLRRLLLALAQLILPSARGGHQ